MENIIKDKKSISGSYIENLRNWIIQNQHSYFCSKNKAISWYDFVKFPTLKSDRNHLCMPDEVMLIDRAYKGTHTYCICTISSNGKLTSQIPVIAIDELDGNAWRNGYFLLPDLTNK